MHKDGDRNECISGKARQGIRRAGTGDPRKIPAVVQTKGHVAFYPDRVDEMTEQLPKRRKKDSFTYEEKFNEPDYTGKE
jgi:hypothetical protein